MTSHYTQAEAGEHDLCQAGAILFGPCPELSEIKEWRFSELAWGGGGFLERSINKQLEINHVQDAVPSAYGGWHSFRKQINDLFDRFSNGASSVAQPSFDSLENFWMKNTVGFAPAGNVRCWT